MNWIYITAAPDIARHVESCGVQQVMIDLETEGKEARQGHLDTHMASHTLADIPAVAAALTRAELMVRINPLSQRSAAEVEAVLAAGARRLMLPMFRSADDVRRLKALVGGRVPVTLLVETPEALDGIAAYLPLLGGADRVHFGLNDLNIALDLGFVFAPLARGLIDPAAVACRAAGIPFGVGGIGRVGPNLVSAEMVMGEHVRLGSEWVILSRAFRGSGADVATLRAELDVAAELDALLGVEQRFRAAGPAALAANQASFGEAVDAVIAKRAS